MSPNVWGFIIGFPVYIVTPIIVDGLTNLPYQSCWLIGVAVGMLVWTHVEEFVMWRRKKRNRDFE